MKLNEFDIYGSKRIGVIDTNLVVYEPSRFSMYFGPPILLDTTRTFYLEGQHRYELTNHLGNVLVTVSDRKWSIDTNHLGYAQYYLPNVVNSQDYYPFGMVEPGRQYAILGDSAYRFGFNGKEHDDNIYGKDNSYDYGKRFYDPRIGKLLSTDPMFNRSPDETPYNFVGDNPILRIDIDGNWYIEVHIYKDREKYGYGLAIVKDRSGNEVDRFEIRAIGIGGNNTNNENANTPLGTYCIPNNKDAWKSGGDREAYGPNPRLVLETFSGDAQDAENHKRKNFRMHGGHQEYKNKKGQWVSVKNPILEKTKGCLRAGDKEIKQLKEITDNLEKKDSKEGVGKTLKIVSDLILNKTETIQIPNLPVEKIDMSIPKTETGPYGSKSNK